MIFRMFNFLFGASFCIFLKSLSVNSLECVLHILASLGSPSKSLTNVLSLRKYFVDVNQVYTHMYMVRTPPYFKAVF